MGGIADEVDVQVGRAVTALQFQDIVSQLLGHVGRRIDAIDDVSRHLGGLARRLRMAGFDTLYRNDFEDGEIAEIAGQENRVVLTRDRDLLKHRVITHGCYIHTTKPPQQFYEVMLRLNLAAQQRPFTLCMVCNQPLRPVSRDSIFENLPLSVRTNPDYVKFTTCDCCGRVYWKGSHWQHMAELFSASAQAQNA